MLASDKAAENLLHQQHLTRPLDGGGHAALVRRGQAGVFPRQNAALIGHERAEQVRVLVVERVNGEVDFRLRTRGAVCLLYTSDAADE